MENIINSPYQKRCFPIETHSNYYASSFQGDQYNSMDQPRINQFSTMQIPGISRKNMQKVGMMSIAKSSEIKPSNLYCTRQVSMQASSRSPVYKSNTIPVSYDMNEDPMYLSTPTYHKQFSYKSQDNTN